MALLIRVTYIIEYSKQKRCFTHRWQVRRLFERQLHLYTIKLLLLNLSFWENSWPIAAERDAAARETEEQSLAQAQRQN